MRDAKCTKMENDSAEMAQEINSLKIQKAEFKANEQDLKSTIVNNKMLITNYKAPAIYFQEKYTKAQGKANSRGKLLIGSLVVNIVLIGLLVVILK